MPDKRIVLVLWADDCDEMAALSFVTILRRQGVRVKLVGAIAGRAEGVSGVALMPDITLEQAIPLAGQASAVIVPGGIGALHRLDNDPRVRDLLRRAVAHQAFLISSPEAGPELTALLAGEHNEPLVASYPDDRRVLEFADRLGERLALSPPFVGAYPRGRPSGQAQGRAPTLKL